MLIDFSKFDFSGYMDDPQLIRLVDVFPHKSWDWKIISKSNCLTVGFINKHFNNINMSCIDKKSFEYINTKRMAYMCLLQHISPDMAREIITLRGYPPSAFAGMRTGKNL